MSPIVCNQWLFLRMLLRFSILFFSYLNYNVLWLDLFVNLIWESDFQACVCFVLWVNQVSAIISSNKTVSLHLDSYNENFAAFAVAQISLNILIFKILSFSCAIWVVSTTLSSDHLIYSFEASNAVDFIQCIFHFSQPIIISILNVLPFS